MVTHIIEIVCSTRRVFVCAALVAVLFALSVLTGAGSLAHAAPTLSVSDLLNPDGTLNTSRGINGALDLRGWNVTLDAARGPILSPNAPAPAAPNAPTWSALANNGLNSQVHALAVIGSDLYVGGQFTQAVSPVLTLNRIAKYSGGAWAALANNGLSGDVYALAVSGSDLYVGGSFTQTGDLSLTLNRIAKYSGGAWAALANQGLNSNVNALAMVGGDLYVGGMFTQTVSPVVTNLYRIAKYSGGTWSPLANNGLNNAVSALAVSGTDLYVGGWFTVTYDGAVTNLNRIAKYDTSGGGAWSAFANQGLNNNVTSIAVLGSDLYVGGNFNQTVSPAVTLYAIAKYSGGAWSALADNGLNGTVNAMVVSGGDLYVGGNFTSSAGGATPNMNRIAKYSGGAWSALPNNGLGGGPFPSVNALAMNGSDLYAGGWFTQSADSAVPNLNFIAKLSGTTAINVLGPQARVNATNVALKWQTTTETDIAGFDVYRQTGKRAWKKINAALIEPKHPGDAAGASYRFTDARVKAGKTYRYKIQVWYLDGHNEWTGSVRVKMK